MSLAESMASPTSSLISLKSPFMLSTHLLCCLPLFCCPSTIQCIALCANPIASICDTWPNQSSFLFFIVYFFSFCTVVCITFLCSWSCLLWFILFIVQAVGFATTNFTHCSSCKLCITFFNILTHIKSKTNLVFWTWEYSSKNKPKLWKSHHLLQNQKFFKHCMYVCIHTLCSKKNMWLRLWR